tara:strand:- start:1938 stop:2960 length:1023 start_codon:yes stop_codon:yes gene_type:complete
MKKIILIPTLLFSLILFSQESKKQDENGEYFNNLQTENQQLKDENSRLESKIELHQQEINTIKNTLNLKADNTELELEIDSIKFYYQQFINNIKSNINKKANIVSVESINNSLENKIDSANSNINRNTTQLDSDGENIKDILTTLNNQNIHIQTTSGKVEKNNLYILLCFLLGLLLLLTCIVIYKLTSKNKTNISSTKGAIKEILKLDNDLKNLLEKEAAVKPDKGGNSEEETLKAVKMVADEITTMENNIYQMDPGTKGLNRIVRAIKNLRNNYKVMGYDIQVLLGNEFNDGDIMEVISDMPDEKIEKGKRIITRIVSPRIDHKGKMIQKAKVELKSNI